MQAWAAIGELARDLGEASRSPQKLPLLPADPAAAVPVTAPAPGTTAAAESSPAGPRTAPQDGRLPLPPTEEEARELDVLSTQQGLAPQGAAAAAAAHAAGVVQTKVKR